jgi:hypothetical protein
MLSPLTPIPSEVQTLHRIVFDNGHCLLPRQNNPEDYLAMMDEDVQKLAGELCSVHDTGIPVNDGDCNPEESLTLCMENICGTFQMTTDNVFNGGEAMKNGIPRIGTLIEHRQFMGTHYLLHTVHGRLAYRLKKKIWNFKGARSLEDLVTFVRDLTQDTDSPIYPTVNMLSVTLRTNAALVIDPTRSLLHRVLKRLYSSVASIQTRVDDCNNLYFIDVLSWKAMLALFQTETQCVSNAVSTEEADMQHIREYLKAAAIENSPVPSASIGYTRSGVFFIRITFPNGLLCAVVGSNGVVDGVSGTHPAAVCAGGVEPFINIIVRFIVLVLVKIRAVG